MVLSSGQRSAGKQKPGSGGEHRDPGWLFRIEGELEGRVSGVRSGPDCRGADSLTLTKDAGLAARFA